MKTDPHYDKRQLLKGLKSSKGTMGLLKAQNLETFAAYLAWALVCYVTLRSLGPGAEFPSAVMVLLGYIIAFYFTTKDGRYKAFDQFKRKLALSIQFILIIVLYAAVKDSIVLVLSVIVAAQLPFVLKPWQSFLGALSLSSLTFVLSSIESQDSPFMTTAIYTSLNLFAYIMAQRVIREQKSREEIDQLNRELLATKTLFEESTKQSERLRISRDLHDVLGHHLTALILNLQFLTHTTEGPTQKKATEAHSLAKLLLSDVRETVHQMRYDSDVDIVLAINTLISNIPKLSIEFNHPGHLGMKSANSAEAIVRCVQEAITNCLKHSNASKFVIDLNCDIENLFLTMSDDGNLTKKEQLSLSDGNGVKGMKERIEKLNGSLINDYQDGYRITINLPMIG